jgi:hypothetical protein
LHIKYEVIASALRAAEFPESVCQFLSKDYLLRMGRQKNSGIRHIRSGSQRSEPLWDAMEIQRFIFRRYGRAIPLHVTACNNEINRLCAQLRIQQHNQRDADRANATASST